jgi:hypothetical protein
MQLWAQDLPEISSAENSQRAWSGEYFAKWLAQPQAGVLGPIPLTVLTRAEGGYDSDLDVPAAQLEKKRKVRSGQADPAFEQREADHSSVRSQQWSWKHRPKWRRRSVRWLRR